VHSRHCPPLTLSCDVGKSTAEGSVVGVHMLGGLATWQFIASAAFFLCLWFTRALFCVHLISQPYAGVVI
jgi:hypothetical protein